MKGFDAKIQLPLHKFFFFLFSQRIHFFIKIGIHNHTLLLVDQDLSDDIPSGDEIGDKTVKSYNYMVYEFIDVPDAFDYL
jgi:hypothetical protein